MAVPVKRLLKRQNFLALKKEGLRVNTQSFVLQYMPVAAEPGIAVGFTTSGALGNAVHRNRARRRLKAAFDDALRLNPHAQARNLHVVIVGKMPVFDIQYDYLRKDMIKALAEAGVTWAE